MGWWGRGVCRWMSEPVSLDSALQKSAWPVASCYGAMHLCSRVMWTRHRMRNPRIQSRRSVRNTSRLTICSCCCSSVSPCLWSVPDVGTESTAWLEAFKAESLQTSSLLERSPCSLHFLYGVVFLLEEIQELNQSAVLLCVCYKSSHLAFMLNSSAPC